MDDGGAQQAELANLLGVIERAGGDLALAEEPSRFVAALENSSAEGTKQAEAGRADPAGPEA